MPIQPGLTWRRRFDYHQAPAPIPTIYWVPDSIDGTDTTDMTSAINAWIATIPDYSNLAFKAGATYRVEGTIALSARAGLLFQGNGATFHCHGAPVESQPMWNANDCQYISLQNMHLTASYASPGTYNAAVEHAHAIDLRGVTEIDIDSIVMTNFAGDGIYLGLGLTGAQTLCSGQLDALGALVPAITNCTMNGSGRNMISFVACQNVMAQNCTSNTIGLYHFDVEPNALPGYSVNNVTVDHCVMGTARSYSMAVIENAPISNITYSNNTTNDPNGMKIIVDAVLANPVRRPSNVTIVGNSCPTQYSNPDTFSFRHVDGLTVTGNAIPMWCSDPVKTYMAIVEDCTSATVSGNDVSVFAGPGPTPPAQVFFVPLDTVSRTIQPGHTWARRFRRPWVAPQLAAATSNTVAAAVALSGSGTLTAAEIPAVAVPVALAGSGSLTTVDTATVAVTVTLSGAGSLSTADIPAVPAAVGLSGAGTLSATAAPAVPVAAALSGTGSLTTADTAAVTVTAALSGSGALTTVDKPTVSITAALSGAGTLTTANVPAVAVTAALSGSGTLSTVGKPAVAVTVALAGSGTLTTTTAVPVSLSGTGTLSTAATPTVPTAPALAGAGTLTTSAHPALTASVALGASGTLNSSAVPGFAAPVTFTGVGTLTAVGLPQLAALAALAGAGTLSAAGVAAIAPDGFFTTGAATTRWGSGPPRTRWATGAPGVRWADDLIDA